MVPEQDTGVLSQKSEQKSAQEQMMTNPDMMSGMMKQNLFGIIPQVGFRMRFWGGCLQPKPCFLGLKCCPLRLRMHSGTALVRLLSRNASHG